MKRLESKFDIILNWQIHGKDDSELLPELLEQYNRWDYADRLINNYLSVEEGIPRPKNMSYSEIAIMIVRKFGCSTSTANRDIRDSQLFFGASRKIDKDYYRNVFLTLGMEALYKLNKKKDYPGVLKGIEKLGKILGLQWDETKVPDWGNLEPNKYVFIIQLNKKEAFEIDLDQAYKLPPGYMDKILLQMQQAEYLDFTDVN